MIKVWTDGSCKAPKGSSALGIGVLLDFGENLYLDLAAALRKGPDNSNQTAELLAAIVGLNLIDPTKGKQEEIILVTDSEYVIYQAQGKWKTAPENLKFVKALQKLTTELNVSFEHVRGHQGIHENEICDELAGWAVQAHDPNKEGWQKLAMKIYDKNNGDVLLSHPGGPHSYDFLWEEGITTFSKATVRFRC